MKEKERPQSQASSEGINNNYALDEFILLPDTLPGCFGEYNSAINIACYQCKVRLPCARNTAGRELK